SYLNEKSLVLVSSASGTISSFITSRYVKRYLSEHDSKHGVEEARVQLRHGRVEVEGKWQFELAGFKLLRIPFSAIAELFPANGNEIHWRLVRATVAEIVPLPAGWLQERLREFNPLIRFDLSPMQVQLQTINVSPEGLKFEAEFTLSPTGIR
ncbi:MAG: LmeA family phospholipid-binding protein, partial [Candidatus Fervidibacter sp.]|uniref:LmeA family phospholipid-binding protein n=1 Tax=Candidatus Fervidibacter sp. TaxID=3100871 RepID=UPI004049C3E4